MAASPHNAKAFWSRQSPRLRIIKFKIEIEEYPGQNESHLDIREVSVNAVPRANGERLQYISVIVDECRITIFEEMFGDE